eukprot:scaffold2431_cov116-Isochrysis_galbana.AAC.7
MAWPCGSQMRRGGLQCRRTTQENRSWGTSGLLQRTPHRHPSQRTQLGLLGQPHRTDGPAARWRAAELGMYAQARALCS